MQVRQEFEKESGEYAFIANPNYIEWLEKQCSKLDGQEYFIKRLQGQIVDLESKQINWKDLKKEQTIEEGDLIFLEGNRCVLSQFTDLIGTEVGNKEVKRKITITPALEENKLVIFNDLNYKERLEKGLATPEDVEIYIRNWIKDGETGMYTYLGFSTYDAEQYTKHGQEYLKKLHNSNKE